MTSQNANPGMPRHPSARVLGASAWHRQAKQDCQNHDRSVWHQGKLHNVAQNVSRLHMLKTNSNGQATESESQAKRLNGKIMGFSLRHCWAMCD